MLKVVHATEMSDAWYEQGRMPWPKTGATQYHAELKLPDKNHAIKGLVVYNNLDGSAFVLAKRCGAMLLSTIPVCINRI